MTVKGLCPTPRKPKYYDHILVDTLVLQNNYNRGRNLESYECGDHLHIRDKDKRKFKERMREARIREARKKYRQLTIFDWMNELNGAQGL